MDPPNTNTMYLSPVTENEILNIVKHCNSKNSEDVNNISMIIIKYIIKAVVKPFNTIFNLSFNTGSVWYEGFKNCTII